MKTLVKPLFLLITALMLTIAGCKKETTPTPEKPFPSIADIEIGTGNNERGTIGKDFHFNAAVTAGEKLTTIQIKVQQRATETYTKVWGYEVTWNEFNGLKNATVHKHFTIPAEATEGKYDFLIIVNDQNGTRAEIKKNITLVR